MKAYYAHSTESENKDDWQPLEEHLGNVSDRARIFASYFGAGKWGELCGLWHDAGKATDAFQRRLEGEPIRVDHSTFGAGLAHEKCGRLGPILAYAIAGHHGGMPDGGDQEGQLHFRLKHGKVPDDVVHLLQSDSPGELLPPFKLSRERAGFSLSFFTRMLFSCLVDADFLDTEAFCNPKKSQARSMATDRCLFSALKKSFDDHLFKKIRRAESSSVNKLRQMVLAQCREKAKEPPGFFSLTVPTGGGKTLSSLAFALEHVVENREKFGLRRIIYAIPFTSIIEQNAKVFQDVLGREHILEHHCNYRQSDEPEDRAYNLRRGLAVENWDAPVVVTTNVQFFESLFSNKPSRCRKLHNIAKSVIILDEAQAIPTGFIEPCLAALRELVAHYGCSVVLCTATQPAIDDQSSLRMALPKVDEIVKEPRKLYKSLRRTQVNFIGQTPDVELAERLEKEDQVLCIVSTKPHARALLERLTKEKGLYHLSTNMYPCHRRRVLDDIRARLKENKTCRVVSTSLVEAGVDLDFPVVYRAMAGLDSIAQAAGRCNREGKMSGPGKVFVFEAEKPSNMPWLKRCMTRAAEALRTFPKDDPLGMTMMRRYFELLYDVEDLDHEHIMDLLNPELSSELHWPFAEAARAFRLIQDDSTGIIVAIEPEARELVRQLRFSDHPRSILRKLQQYSIGVRTKDFAALDAAGALEIIQGEFPLLNNTAAYRDDVGLCVDGGKVLDPESLIL